MEKWLNFNKSKVWKTDLDKDFIFAIFKIVNLTAFSVRRDRGFYFYEQKSIRFY